MVASIARVFGLLLVGLLVALAGLLHLWYRGVLAAPEVKRRKVARRAARLS
jgi:hypothetical protein